jgi:hypothetical protein
MALLVFLLVSFAISPPADGQETRRPFRTDADGPVPADAGRKGLDPDDPLKWYELVDGQFPPEGSAHAVSGELIQLDPVERRFLLRVDRNDHQLRGDWDLPIDAVMLPYGTVHYHGAPADIRDIPIGTHLHGLFYLRAPDDPTPHPVTPNNRQTPEVDFRRCFQLEDDFSFHARQKQLWKVRSIDHASMKLVAALQRDGMVVGDPKSFDLLPHTRVFQAERLIDFNAIRPGQSVLMNLTWVTLYGPGRVLDVWIDEAARRRATARQLKRHRHHIRQRGLAGWVDSVDDQQKTVTITFFGGVDPKLFDELGVSADWPEASSSEVAKQTPPAQGSLVVARPSLMTYAPTIDKKRARILKRESVPIEPGSSGVRIRLEVDMMLEGFRPTRIVRFYPQDWPLIALPREEQFFGRE